MGIPLVINGVPHILSALAPTDVFVSNWGKSNDVQITQNL
jgi:hypothetical protein